LRSLGKKSLRNEEIAKAEAKKSSVQQSSTPDYDDDDDDEAQMGDEASNNVDLMETRYGGFKHVDIGPPDSNFGDTFEYELLQRQMSAGFWEQSHFDKVENITNLISWKDKEGNTAAHYAAQLGLSKSLQALYAAGASKWTENKYGETPAGIIAGVDYKSVASISLHKICSKRNFIRQPLLSYAFRIPIEYSTSSEFVAAEEAILDDRPLDALQITSDLIDDRTLGCEIYYAIALLMNGFAPTLAAQSLQNYENRFSSRGIPNLVLNPLYFYARYLLLLKDGSYLKKRGRLLTADALSACRLFPSVANKWLNSSDNIDTLVIKEGLDKADEDIYDEFDDSEDDETDALDYVSPEAQWKVCKKIHKAVSPSMDSLMQLVGLRKIKTSAVTVFKEVLLSQIRSKMGVNVDTQTTMNFLFVGNPGKPVNFSTLFR